jgi:hypothetical protein
MLAKGKGNGNRCRWKRWFEAPAGASSCGDVLFQSAGAQAL